jgi:hypothetical protein
MTPTTRERLLERAYDAEQAGDLKEAARLRKLAREDAPPEPPVAAEATRWRAHRLRLYYPTGR